jgi:preprotein translocase subunit SecF
MDKKKAITAIILFILTLSSGLFLIKYGIDKTEKIKIEYQENTNKKNISEKEKSKEELLTQKKEKENKLTEEKQNGYTDYYYSLENEINKIEEQVTEIEFEISKIKNGYYDNKASIDAGVKKGIIFILPGVALLIISLVIIIINFKKRK